MATGAAVVLLLDTMLRVRMRGRVQLRCGRVDR